MKRMRPDTRLEVWGDRYINFPELREGEKDRTARIIQIEPGNGGDYIVEVLDVCPKE